MRMLIGETAERDCGYIECRHPRDFPIGAGGKEFVLVEDGFEMAVSWFREILCTAVISACVIRRNAEDG